MNIVNLIKEFNNLVSRKFSDFKGIYLFGSRATGKAKKESDVDLVLMFNEINKTKKYEIYDILSDLMFKYDIFIDIQIMDEAKLKFNPYFHEQVTSKGKFYGAT
ncbi:MAG: nucleotidyltransferase domain-containing protein [Candidatus Gastranaerophilaceae bacterium]